MEQGDICEVGNFASIKTQSDTEEGSNSDWKCMEHL